MSADLPRDGRLVLRLLLQLLRRVDRLLRGRGARSLPLLRLHAIHPIFHP